MPVIHRFPQVGVSRVVVVIRPHARSRFARFALMLGSAGALLAQAPQITSAGVVNAASYAQPITPGALVSIFGTNLANTTASATGLPLPTQLAGTSVTVNGVPAPLLFVSSSQIDIQVPWSTMFCYICVDFESASFVLTNATGSTEPVKVPISMAAPAAFTVDKSGCGQAIAFNVAADGSISLNSSSNSAAPGDYISLFGTGFGTVYFPPPDGAASPNAQQFEVEDGVALGVNSPISASILPAYSGFAPGLVGVDQINFQIPAGTPEGCAVPLMIQGQTYSPAVTLSVHTGRGKCSDPPVQSYGQIALMKTVASGTLADGETDTLTAVFPSGPGLPPPLPLAAPSDGEYIARTSPPSAVSVPGVSRACSVPEYDNLSAGQITVTSATNSVLAQPVTQVGGVTYQQALPPGFISPGTYQLSASGGPVQFKGPVTVGSPIQVEAAPLAPGTVVSSSVPFTVNWTGGDPGTLVTVYIVSGLGLAALADYAQADASAGSVTFNPLCSGNPYPMGNGTVCTLTLPTMETLEVVVDVTPFPSKVVSLPAQGLTGAIQITWDYRFVFGGMMLGE